jgi:hypothetical protein
MHSVWKGSISWVCQPDVKDCFKTVVLRREDSHLALALEVALRERGYVLRSEDNQIQAIAAIKELHRMG